MKNYINFLFVGSLCITQSFSAQAQQVSWFEAEQYSYFDLKGFVPGSDVQLYSHRTGGMVLLQSPVDGTGALLIKEVGDKFRPAFTLSINTQNRAGIKGNGKVRFFETPEFSIRDIEIRKIGNAVRIDWLASSNIVENVSFEVLRSNDGVNFRVVDRIEAAKTVLEYQYSYTSEYGNTSAIYQVRVVTTNRGDRYSSKPLALDNRTFMVYPTITSDVLKINIDGDAPASFRLVNELGATVKTGKLSFGENTLSLIDLIPGIYLVRINAGSKVSVSKITKL